MRGEFWEDRGKYDKVYLQFRVAGKRDTRRLHCLDF